MTDYRALFRSDTPASLTAQEVFTDRLDQRTAFRLSLEALVTAGSDGVLDPRLPRRNVLAFYGIGGVGKTTLSKELERSVADDDRIATLRLDFADAAVLDVETVVLALRATAGELGRRLTAFDLALARYWELAHPGEPLATHVARTGALKRLSERVGLSDHVQEAVLEVGQALGSSSTAAKAGVSAVRSLATAVQQSKEQRHLVQECPWLVPLLEADADDDLVSHLPALLGWELTRAAEGRVVVFLDTYEIVQQRGRPLERHLQRICHLLPNVLFVVTGRNRLDWADPRLLGELDHVGPVHWPGLADGATDEPRSHLVGDLSPEDAESYLCDRLRDEHGPAIAPEIRSRIIAGSGGLPLYLDLSVTAYCSALVEGRQPQPEEFGLPFPALVSRVMRDLSLEERAVLRGVSLLDGFDAELARAAGGAVSAGSVERLLQRPFVVVVPDRVLPYSLHAALRASVRDGQELLPDTWAGADWQEAARRLDAELERRSGTAEADALPALVTDGLRVAAAGALPLGWQLRATRRLAAANRLASLPLVDLEAARSEADWFLVGVGVLAHGRSAPAGERAALLAQVVEHLPASSRPWLELARADSLLVAGAYSAAEQSYAGLQGLALDEDVADHLAAMSAVAALKQGRFVDVTTGIALHGNTARVLGDAARLCADWPAAQESYAVGLRAVEAQQHVGLQALFRTTLALVKGWSGRDWGKQAADAVGFAEDLGGWALAAAHVAAALALTGFDARGALRAREEGRAVAAAYGGHDIELDLVMVEAFEAAVLRDARGLLAARERGKALIAHDGSHPHLSDVLDWWAGEDPSTDVQWIGGASAAADRWRATVAVRQAAAGR